MQLQRYCTCGAVLNVNVPQAKKAQVLGNWFEKHTGTGHAPATRSEAEHARMGFAKETQP
jgi:hypothetical protein